MESQNILLDAFDRIRDGMRRVAEGLDSEALAYRPDSEANSVGWLVWHATRVADHHVAELAGREQAWIAEGWAERLGMPPDPQDTGYRHTPDQVAAVRLDGAETVLGYHEAVAARVRDYIETMDEAELQRIVDYRWDPPVSAAVRLVSVISDQLQHMGQAAYVRGLYERRTGG